MMEVYCYGIHWKFRQLKKNTSEICLPGRYRINVWETYDLSSFTALSALSQAFVVCSLSNYHLLLSTKVLFGTYVFFDWCDCLKLAGRFVHNGAVHANVARGRRWCLSSISRVLFFHSKGATICEIFLAANASIVSNYNLSDSLQNCSLVGAGEKKKLSGKKNCGSTFSPAVQQTPVVWVIVFNVFMADLVEIWEFWKMPLKNLAAGTLFSPPHSLTEGVYSGTFTRTDCELWIQPRNCSRTSSNCV